MAAGDWSGACRVRPQSFSFTFDAATPPDIVAVTTQYVIEQPSGNVVQSMRTWKPAAPVPIAQGINGAIVPAVQDLAAYEGLAVG